MTSPPALRTERLLLRPWRAEDRAPFAALNADPVVAEFLPGPIDRARSDALVDRIEAHFAEHGFGLWAVEMPGEVEFAGFVGLAVPRFEAAFTPCVEVGWRLARETWGRGIATEAGRAALRFGFGDAGLAEIVSFTVPANLRSRRVMERLGLSRNPADDFEHPGLPEGHALRSHVLYRIARSLAVSVEFQILRDEPERLEGIAPGIDKAHLRKLRRGEFPVDAELDLHGLDQKQARVEVRAALAALAAEGGRCLYVVHGRGAHSEGGTAVLRSALVRWLAESPTAPRIMAFASGLRERGGATYVLLRRQRGG